MMVCAVASAKYGGGSGNLADPYQIFTAEQLNEIGANPADWDKHFLLMENIDLKQVAAVEAHVEFPLLVGLMRGHGMIPIGVRGGTAAQNAAAEAMELAVLSDGVRH